MKEKTIYNLTLVSVGLAFILWYFIFVIQPFNFWFEMSIVTSLLIVVSLILNRGKVIISKISLRHIVVGVGSAILLYGFFWVGNILSSSLFSFQEAQIADIYINRTKAPLELIALLLVFPIAVGEEIYWRGLVQNKLASQWGKFPGFLMATAAYGLVHIVTLNFMLVLAAMVAGLFWGWLYYREESVVPTIISHILWDLMVFVFFPLSTNL